MGSSALKARLGWLTLLASIDEEGKARSWDKCLALAQGRNEKQEQQKKAQQQRFIHGYRTSVLSTRTVK